MSREGFFNHVGNLRNMINENMCKISSGYAHRYLDNIINVFTNKEEVVSEESIEKDLAKIIERIKNSKEKEKLTNKAKELIKHIEDTLDK